MAVAEIIAIGWLVGQYIYHRWIDPPEKPKEVAWDVEIPKTEEGSPIPLIYGRCRVKQPILAWYGPASAIKLPEAATIPFWSWLQSGNLYFCDMFYVIGIPFEYNVRTLSSPDEYNTTTSTLWKMWAGELRLNQFGGSATFTQPNVTLEELTGQGGFEINRRVAALTSKYDESSSQLFECSVEFLNGNPSQRLVAEVFPYGAQTQAGETLSVSNNPALIPGYRGYLSAFLTGITDVYGSRSESAVIGLSPQIPAVSFEVSSYPSNPLWAPLGLLGIPDLESVPQYAYDANPADVIFDMLIGKRGKLGLPVTSVDTATFQNAAETLYREGNGFSRALDGGRSAKEYVNDILKQIDGVLYQNPKTQQVCLKLIRADYDVSEIPVINENNCEALEDYAAGSWTNVYNKIRVKYTRRTNGYREDSVTAQNQANAVGQDNQERELILDYPGVTNSINAKAIAAREMSARSRPIARCVALVDRSFYYTNPGDAVTVYWHEPDISGMVFRVVSVTRGIGKNQSIKLELIQDYFSIFRGIPVRTVPVAAFPTVADPT